nr:hypothetical protein Iba_chr05cCG0440 [Ipomoea batatas]
MDWPETEGYNNRASAVGNGDFGVVRCQLRRYAASSTFLDDGVRRLRRSLAMATSPPRDAAATAFLCSSSSAKQRTVGIMAGSSGGFPSRLA